MTNIYSWEMKPREAYAGIKVDVQINYPDAKRAF